MSSIVKPTAHLCSFNTFFLLPLFFFTFGVTAQNSTNDSLLIFATKHAIILRSASNVLIQPGPRYYKIYRQGSRIVYYKSDAVRHEGIINKVGNDYLIIDSVRVPVNEIEQIGKVRLQYDALILSKKDYRKLRAAKYNEINSPAYHQAAKQIESKIEDHKAKIFARRNKEYLYPHSITFNIFEPLDNQATLTYSYRINERLGIDISPGFYFKTEDRVETIPNITYEQSHPGFNYSKNEFRGFQLNPGLKLYFPKKPNRYFEFLWLNRYIYYNHERVPVYYYYDLYSSMAEQSERTYVTGFNILYGWQATIKKHLTLDFFFGLGAINRMAKIIEYKGGFHPGETVTYPNTHYLTGIFFSFQGGVKIGLRFGKRKSNPTPQ